MVNILYNLIVHFCDYPVQVHSHFFFFSLAGMFVFFLLMFRRSLYMKDMNPLPVLFIENIPIPHSAFR